MANRLRLGTGPARYEFSNIVMFLFHTTKVHRSTMYVLKHQGKLVTYIQWISRNITVITYEVETMDKHTNGFLVFSVSPQIIKLHSNSPRDLTSTNTLPATDDNYELHQKPKIYIPVRGNGTMDLSH